MHRINRLLTTLIFLMAQAWVSSSHAQEKPEEPKRQGPADPVKDKKDQEKEAPAPSPPARSVLQLPSIGERPVRSPSLASTPNMLGDSNGGACGSASFNQALLIRADHPALFCNQIKIAENNSAIPQDRLYFTYQLFDNATNEFSSTLTADKSVHANLSINRYLFGIEKTLFNQYLSVEFRVPLNTQLANNFTVVTGQDVGLDTPTQTDIGNMGVALKTLLFSSSVFKFSGGLLTQLPTADDVTLHGNSRSVFTPLLIRQNLPQFLAFIRANKLPLGNYTFTTPIDYTFSTQSVIMSPYMGWVATPTNRFFHQGFLEFDFDASGGAITQTPHFNVFLPNGKPLPLTPQLMQLFGVPQGSQSARLFEQDLMRLDLGFGYWIYRNPNAERLTGLAPTVELHYTQTLSNARLASFNPNSLDHVSIGNQANNLSIVDTVFGATAEFNNRSTLAVGAAVPLTTGASKPFDFEINVQLNFKF